MPLTQDHLQALLGSRYQLQRELGGGSMAAVFLAEDSRHGREVALKVLRHEYAATFAAERFLREIEIAARLQHPHIVPLLDSGEVEGNLFLVMPYIEGESLRVRLGREGRLAVSDVIRIMSDVADALAYAHGKGIIHRDIKPDNVLLAGRHALVADFGVAKAIAASNHDEHTDTSGKSLALTQGVALGTPAYMAPEQATADPNLDHRVDLYALGILGYELLTGAPPFEGPNAQAILTAHVLDAPVPLAQKRPDTPVALAAIIERCLAKSADQRWQSAEELLQQLEPLATPSGGTTPTNVTPVTIRSQRSLWGVALVILMAALLGAGALLLRPQTGPLDITQRQLTFSGRAASAAISPDGQQVAFISDSAGHDRLQVQDIRGGRAIVLATSKRLSYPTWSGDGSEVRCYQFDSTFAQVLQVPRLGGPARLTRALTFSAFSPDGKFLLELTQGGSHLTIRQVTGKDTTSVPIEPGYWHSPPAWSHDGSKVSWSAIEQSGTHVKLFVMSVQALRPILVIDDSVPIGSPTFDGPDDGIYALRGISPVVELVRFPIRKDGSPDGPLRVIMQGLSVGTPDPYVSFSAAVSVSRDGTRLLYAQRQDWSNLGLVNFESWNHGGIPRPLTNGSANIRAAKLSPDGREVALVRSESDGLSLQTMPLEGGQSREIGRFLDSDGLGWSPDGEHLVVGIIDPDSGLGIRVFPLNGGLSTDHLFRKVGSTPAFLSDTEVVAPTTGNRAPFGLISLASDHRQALTGTDTLGWVLYPHASPDGKRLAFAWNRGKGRQGVHVMDLASGEVTEIASGLLNPISWSADGKSLVVVGSQFLADSDRVTLHPVSGGAVRELASFPASMELVDVTRDGRNALVIMHERRSDAWLLQIPARH